MFIDFLLEVFKENRDKNAIAWKGRSFDYAWLIDRIRYRQEEISSLGVKPGTAVALEGDFSPEAIALLLALVEKRCIIAPLSRLAKIDKQKLLDIAGVEFYFSIDELDEVKTGERSLQPGENPDVVRSVAMTTGNELYRELQKREHPGLVLFSSGTSGEPKAAVHDFTVLLEKFKTKRAALRILNFLLFDHWGGLNTMFHTLANGGAVITVQDRSPDGVCILIEKYRIEVLPTSPTFLNLLLISEAYKRYDLSSLKVISYGTEPMPLSTLKKLHSLFPDLELKQTYGLIELGVLRSKSRSADSLWVKLGGEGYKTRVVNGILQIKAKSSMLGYLNAPSPFTEDGWFDTQDAVEVDGEYFRILGRKSDIINVGGQKVYPAEVESIILELDNISEATVFGEKNVIMGNIVCAKVKLIEVEDKQQLAARIKKYCREKLENYKVPVKIIAVEGELHTSRFKKARREDSGVGDPNQSPNGPSTGALNGTPGFP